MLTAMVRRVGATAAAFLVSFASAGGAVSCATASAPPMTGTGGTGGTGAGGGGTFAASVSATTTGGGAPPLYDGGPPFVDAGACAPFAETYMPDCLTCLAASCCSQALACYAAPDCFGYASCQQNCPPDILDAGNECLTACSQNYPMAEPAFGMVTACLHTNCPMVCPY
jgi:hypothetical protein